MKIGIPKQTLADEYRVSLLPKHVKRLIADDHQVYVEKNAGLGIAINDDQYKEAGAVIINTASEVFEIATLIIKVKEPSLSECQYIKKHHIIFTFLHLASHPKLTKKLIEIGCTAIAYETIEGDEGLPLLKPMSEIAGQLAIQYGARCLLKNFGGKGLLLGGFLNAPPAKVVIIGMGTVGYQACIMALGMQANVVDMDVSISRLEALGQEFGNKINTVLSSPETIFEQIKDADMIVGAALIPGAASPVLLQIEDLSKLQPNTVLVDVAIDQGGCFASSRPTSHRDPSFIQDDIIHCCISNLPGCVPITATNALTNSTFPYVLKLANGGVACLREDQYFRSGINIHAGKVTNQAIASEFGTPFIDAVEII